MTLLQIGLGSIPVSHFTGIKPKGLIAQDGHGACWTRAGFHAEIKTPESRNVFNENAPGVRHSAAMLLASNGSPRSAAPHRAKLSTAVRARSLAAIFGLMSLEFFFERRGYEPAAAVGASGRRGKSSTALSGSIICVIVIPSNTEGRLCQIRF